MSAAKNNRKISGCLMLSFLCSAGLFRVLFLLIAVDRELLHKRHLFLTNFMQLGHWALDLLVDGMIPGAHFFCAGPRVVEKSLRLTSWNNFLSGAGAGPGTNYFSPCKITVRWHDKCQ